MGLCASNKLALKDQRHRDSQVDTVSDILRGLHLSRGDGHILYKIFDNLDKDHSKSVDFFEFCKFFHVDPTKFARRCFSLLDVDGTGEIEYGQFIICTWNFCTYVRPDSLASGRSQPLACGAGQAPLGDYRIYFGTA